MSTWSACPEWPATPDSIRTILAFDYSERRVGVAVGQSLTGTAEPLTVVESLASGPDWGRLEAIVREWQPDLFVVGLPLNMDGTRQHTTEAAEKFGRSLSGRFGRPVEWMDERLSTREAQARSRALESGENRQGGRRGRQRGAPDDDLAAQVILEGWLAQR